MSDNAQPAGVPETQPSADAAPNASPGGDQTQPASPPAEEWWTTSTGRSQQQDVVFRKGRRDGKDVGATEERQAILARFNVESLDELDEKLKTAGTHVTNNYQLDTPEQPNEPQASEQLASSQPPGDDQRDAIIRDLKDQIEEMRAVSQKSQDLAQQHEASLQRSLKAELQAKFASLGAHREALGDLAALTMPNVRWTPDGNNIEVVEQDESGALMPARQSIDEYIQSISEQKRWFFAGNGTQGSEFQSPVTQLPVQSGTQSSPSGSFAERLERYKNRPRR